MYRACVASRMLKVSDSERRDKGASSEHNFDTAAAVQPPVMGKTQMAAVAGTRDEVHNLQRMLPPAPLTIHSYAL